MSRDGRLDRLEAVLGSEEPVRIKVARIPGGVAEDE